MRLIYCGDLMKIKYFIGILFLFLIFTACAQQPPVKQPDAKVAQNTEKENAAEKTIAAEPKGNPALTIVSPKDGELIKSSKITIELKAENFNLVPVGSPVKDGEGHFHVWLDSDKKLGPRTSFTFENIASGSHAIVAELVKSDHSSLSPKAAKTIAINAESNYVPKAEVQQEPDVKEYTVEADDNGFYPNKIEAKINETVKINFKFKDDSIYFAGLDVKGPFPTIRYKLKSQQPIKAEFTMKGETKIDSYWPSSGVHKATLDVEVEK